MSDYVLAVDQGTTSTKAVILDAQARIAAVSDPFPLEPVPAERGRVEYDPHALLESVRAAIRSVLRRSGIPARSLRGMGLANQGETVVAFDVTTGEPLYPAISWMDQRAAGHARDLRDHESSIRDSTGLVPDAYFSAPKLRWMLDNVPGLRERAEAATACLATSDVWLLHMLIDERPVLTDAATASRTMLMNLKTRRWDAELTRLLEVPAASLPGIVPNDTTVGHLEEEVCGARVPVCGLCVDQQAALFGQRCFDRGDAKASYGTGCFVLANIGDDHGTRAGGLLTTVGWEIAGMPVYALDGGVYSAGSTVGWLLEGARIADSASEIDAALGLLRHPDEPYFMPALLGLAAPHWLPGATGAWHGLRLETRKEHLLGSALEAVAFRVCEIVDAIRAAGCELRRLRVDGGLTNSAELMQAQADVLGIPVEIFDGCEATACGVGLMAGIGCGLWQPDEIPSAAGARHVRPDSESRPSRTARYKRWRALLEHHKEVCRDDRV